MVENFDEFYEEFYKPQFEWYDTKAINNKKYHRGMKISQISLAAILPVAVTLFPVTSSAFWQNTIIIASVLLIILEALESYLNYQKKWMNYRTTAEGLRREEQMFKTRTKEYEGVENPEKLFIKRVMALTSQENRYWEITTRKAQEA
ncbi:uncharacterized protein Nmag_0361 [Natrialba magadii ATCC 43099]|uniref:DUF4231 domain-containing protein n=1 Tax=Natrialba magadii (strain ATCC 43099 / DSM 3394 / CCM 3739 / CIP 104546 / IAM 13178 / JCM 8861 / NBRC 102185 / NCIMB 2190 / MS3) TaxID=547559 RepID=D3SXD1_NATMM|nr:DUF4231 domain-containing protein [Natrialba magadii]ADD03951.1 uncharacterized protein Nmag_0361 [Natrialba magadii ATCC 43099]ELY33614.1 hypothetical protein C500_02240 [Natrialba magadii ATCC 43099]